ncbi:MAG: helix-turn-helix domain-containing protein [Nitrososphaerales archaeon]
MSYEEFQKRLSENWLDTKEASVYVMLAKSGSLKASELARLCDISRMDAYRILRRLEDTGIVEAVMSRPMKFQAIPPEKAFDTLLKSASEKLLSMKSEKNYLLSLWPSQPFFEEEKKEAEKLRIIQGRVEFNNTLRRAVQSAHKEVLLVTTKNGLSRLFHTGFDRDLEDRAEKGISIRILSKVSEAETEAVEKFASIASLRYLNNPLSTQIMVIDGLQAIVNTALDDSMSLTSEKDTSIWTNSRDHITLLETLFEELWNSSLDLKTARQIIETGVTSPKFHRVVGRDKVSTLEQEILKSAKTAITIMSRSITHSPLFREECTNLLKAAVEKGVKVKILTALKEEDTAMVEELGRRFDLKVTNIEPSLDILSVDNVSFIAVKVSTDKHLPIEQEAFYIREDAYASIMDKFLNEVWEKAENAAMVLESLEWVEHLQIVLQRAAEVLNSKGYSAETPGIVKGSSSLEYAFDLVARKKGDAMCVVVDHHTSAQKVMSFYAKATDCDVHKTILLATPNFQEESIKLASFFGIKTVKLPSTDGDHIKIVDAVVKSFSSS